MVWGCAACCAPVWLARRCTDVTTPFTKKHKSPKAFRPVVLFSRPYSLSVSPISIAFLRRYWPTLAKSQQARQACCLFVRRTLPRQKEGVATYTAEENMCKLPAFRLKACSHQTRLNRIFTERASETPIPRENTSRRAPPNS